MPTPLKTMEAKQSTLYFNPDDDRVFAEVVRPDGTFLYHVLINMQPVGNYVSAKGAETAVRQMWEHAHSVQSSGVTQ